MLKIIQEKEDETVFTDQIRKFMGWYPNASTIKTRKSMQFDGMIVNAHDSG